MLHALLLGAALLAAAPLDTRHTALLDALSSDHGGMSCSPAELRAAAAEATIESVGRVGGDDVVVAHLNGGCLCGAHNCPVYALRLTAAKPRILMTTFGYGVSMHADAPLPRIVVRSHDSALISNEETYAYRDGRYVDVENARVRGDTGARKPNVAVRFALGASSAQLHGNASRDWDDAYTFDAGKGQVLTVDGVSSRGGIAITLFAPRGGPSSISAVSPVTLPETGTYVLRVRPAAERAVPYAFRLEITNAGANTPAPQPVLDAALMRWAQAIPELRCIPVAFGAWSGLRTDKDTSGVPVTLMSGNRFAQNVMLVDSRHTIVAGAGESNKYFLARVPSTGATVLGFEGYGGEESTIAVIAGVTAPPRAVVALAAAPRGRGGIGLGSTRAAVETALGTGRAKVLCGFEAVHYSQSEPRASVAELWVFYRNGVVVAITDIEGV